MGLTGGPSLASDSSSLSTSESLVTLLPSSLRLENWRRERLAPLPRLLLLLRCCACCWSF